MIQPDTAYWIAAARLPGVGPVTCQRWLELFGDMKTVFSTSHAELIAAGVSSKHIAALQNSDWKTIEKDIGWCDKNQCEVITLNDPRYPPLLLETTGMPLLLYVKGDVNLLKEPQCAVVGSRHPTVTGKELAYQFASQLVQSGLHITSGLALGVDAAAHRGALSAGGKTLAVFGTGLNCIYPTSHRQLAEAISANGALISEFSPNEQPRPSHFPRRNRIISGLSLGVLVIEAALKSGSLITARFAAEQGRDVFAIPGSIHNPLARGCHQLIQTGAKLVETASDILEELGALNGIFAHSSPVDESKKEQKLLKALASLTVGERELLGKIDYDITPLDAILLRSGLTAGEVSSMLLSLELQGFAQTMCGGYQRKSSC